jgi:hypothetical protein
VIDATVRYVGKAKCLRAVVRGATIGRPFNDYTYVPPSKVRQGHSPRVRINGLLNEAFCDGAAVSWWWLGTASETEAQGLEVDLIGKWAPLWNRAGVPPGAPRPSVTAAADMANSGRGGTPAGGNTLV